jgi:glucose-1-phosphate adenylyltransferase
MEAERPVAAQCADAIALLLAGGHGDRLQPLTLRRPKPLVPFGGTHRLIDLTLGNCVQSGLTRIAILTQGETQPIHAHVSATWQNRLRMLTDAVGDTKTQNMGTADAVSRALSLVEKTGAELVFILASDHVYRMDYRPMLESHRKSGAGATVGVVEMPVACAAAFGVVEVGQDGRVRKFEEKPKAPRHLPAKPESALVSMGIYLFSQEVLVDAIMENRVLSDSHDLGHDVMPALARSGLLHAYQFKDEHSGAPRYWRDVGTIDAYYKASMDLAATPPLFELGPLFGRAPDAAATAAADVQRSILRTGVRVDADACVRDSILLQGARVGRDARIRGAIVEEGVEIPEGMVAGYDRAEDEKRFAVSPGGVLVIERNAQMGARSLSKKREFLQRIASPEQAMAMHEG